MENHRFRESRPVGSSGHEHRSRSYYTILSFSAAINDSLAFINGHIHKRLCPAQVPWSSTKLWERTIQNKASWLKGRYKTMRLGAGPGVAGNVAESQESGGRLQSRFGGPEAKKGRWITLDLIATLINSWRSSVEGFFVFLVYR